MLVDRAEDVLDVAKWAFGIVSGVMLALAFSWSKDEGEFNRLRSWVALVLALASTAFSVVLLVLMGGIAVGSLHRHGHVQPTLVMLDMFVLVVIGLGVASLVAVWRAIMHLRLIYG